MSVDPTPQLIQSHSLHAVYTFSLSAAYTFLNYGID